MRARAKEKRREEKSDKRDQRTRAKEKVSNNNLMIEKVEKKEKKSTICNCSKQRIRCVVA
jgi:hypothetical protein